MREDRIKAIKGLVENANEIFNGYGLVRLSEFLESYSIESRICSSCGHIMVEGYCIEAGDEYYCSDECLEANMTREEFNDLFADGEGDSYWTEWI